MRSYTSILALLPLVAVVHASPLLQRTDFLKCGITGDGTYTDCDALINDDATWNAAFNEGNFCTFTNPSEGITDQNAYNIACHGDCCVYWQGGSNKDGGTVGPDSAIAQSDAKAILACADKTSNKVNGQTGGNDHRTCVSNTAGCGDCFDDSGEAAS